MKAGMQRLLAALVVLSHVIGTSVLAQAEPEGYRAAIDEAIVEFNAHHFEESRSLFVRAHALSPSARTLRGLGLAEFELREYVACVKHLEAALSSTIKPLEGELKVETQALRDRAAGFVARLTVRSHPEATRLVVDGMEERGAQPLLLSFGSHTLQLFAAGYEPERRSLLLAAGEDRTLDVDLQRVGAADRRSESAMQRGHWYQSPWLWVAVGAVVVAGAATGIALAVGPEQSGSTVKSTTGVVIQSK